MLWTVNQEKKFMLKNEEEFNFPLSFTSKKEKKKKVAFDFGIINALKGYTNLLHLTVIYDIFIMRDGVQSWKSLIKTSMQHHQNCMAAINRFV